MVDIHPILKQRRSGVAFSNEPLEAEKLTAMLEAFRWGPSSRNAQPWRIVVVRTPAAHQKFDEALSANNQKWATKAPVKIGLFLNSIRSSSIAQHRCRPSHPQSYLCGYGNAAPEC